MGSSDAWTNYYQRIAEPVDWFADYEQLENYFDELLTHNHTFTSVVDIGCGSSFLGPKLAGARPNLNVYCIDLSMECLQTLALNCGHANCTFAVGDARRNLPFSDHSVDLVIDKGTSDALIRSKNGAFNFKLMMDEAKRVLQKEGLLLQITTDPPEQKMPQMKEYNEITTISFKKLPIFSNKLPIYAYKVRFFPHDENEPSSQGDKKSRKIFDPSILN